MRLFFLLCAAFALHTSAAHHVPDVNQESQQGNHTPGLSSPDPCPPEFSEFWGRCLAFFPDPVAWIDAEKQCWLYGASLASIHNQEEYDFLIELMIQKGYYGPAWIGAHDAVQFGSCLWSDGSPFEDWTPFLPKSWFRWRHCFSIDSQDFIRFDRRDCKEQLPFVCGTRPGC